MNRAMRRGMIEADAAGWEAMLAEGITPGWLRAWLAARGVDAGWRLLADEADGGRAGVDGAMLTLRIVAPDAVRRWLPQGDAPDALNKERLALADPDREAWLVSADGNGGARLLLLPAGGLIHARDRWLDALAGPPCCELRLHQDESGALPLEPGLSASVGTRHGKRGEAAPDLALPEEMLVSRLRARGMRLRLAESCTGGMIAARICRVSGASAVFDRGWVTYANEAKTTELGVPSALLARHGAVSREVVEAMVAGAGEDYARIAVSGIAGPGGGSPEKPVGTVWIAAALPGGSSAGVQARRFMLEGSRARIRSVACVRALGMLLEMLGDRGSV